MNSSAKDSHCIVTPDFIGPVKNGGIGTACYELARFLSGELGVRITILFTGPMMHKTAREWSDHYAAAHGWELFWLNDVYPQKRDLSEYNNTPWFVEQSHRVDMWLRDKAFAQVHFQEWQANGFCSAQAKEQGIAHRESYFTCTVHSPHQWIAEGARAFPSKGIEDLLQHYCERYSACKADLTIFPSRHMRDWAQSKGWVPRESCVVPNIYQGAGPTEKHLAAGSREVKELCFFGRLEARKGLELYLTALEAVVRAKGAGFLPHLSFVGKIGLAGGMNSAVYLKKFADKLGLKIEVHSSLDAESAVAYLQSESGRVAVVPSLADNLPYTVVECVEKKIPLIASAVGGIPEIIASEGNLFEPRAASLAEKIIAVVENGVSPAGSGYSLEEAKEKWATISHKRSHKQKVREVLPKDITVCIAYYNYGKYLPDLLRSLAGQTAEGFRVIVVNDGSTDTESNEVFDRMKEEFGLRDGWLFLRQENSGIGATRNFAASRVETAYIVFMDADNVAKPEVVETMAESMSYSEADCLSCYMEGFNDGDCPLEGSVAYEYLPVGGCVEAGLFMNVCGDANFIVKKSVFDQISGFTTDRTASFEDWEFLARLMLGGFNLDVIPRPLFRYRHTKQGFSRSTSAYLNHRRVVDAYAAHLPDWAGGLIEGAYKQMVPRCDDYPPSTFLAKLAFTARVRFQTLPPVARSLGAKFYRRLRSVMAL